MFSTGVEESNPLPLPLPIQISKSAIIQVGNTNPYCALIREIFHAL